ncbi:MAG TPA: hypothetical protein VFG12_14580 [Rhodopila sp.]|jgi:hypothetical protein|nr:hypothetical protein [Rhodopila sp.]
MATLPNRAKTSRRLLLAAAACGLAHQAAAQPAKVSRETAKYQDTPRDGMSCEACSFFRRPAACQVVIGAISPHGWCQLFDMPD